MTRSPKPAPGTPYRQCTAAYGRAVVGAANRAWGVRDAKTEGVQRRGTVRAVVLAQFYGVSCVRHTVVLRLRAEQKRWSEAVVGSRTASAGACTGVSGERAAVAARPRVGSSCAVGGV